MKDIRLSKIRLKFARTKEFLEASRDIGYEFTAPLKADGRIDVDAFHKPKASCRVHRFPKDEDQEDESGYRFGDHLFRVGEYVSLQEDEELMPYQVKDLEDVK